MFIVFKLHYAFKLIFEAYNVYVYSKSLDNGNANKLFLQYSILYRMYFTAMLYIKIEISVVLLKFIWMRK